VDERERISLSKWELLKNPDRGAETQSHPLSGVDRSCSLHFRAATQPLSVQFLFTLDKD